MPAQSELDLLLERLEKMLSQPVGGDAIDSELRSTPRASATTSLRDHEVVRLFRQEMSDGSIRLDTANHLLSLLRGVLDLAVKP